jgi:hypothetical protein
MAIPPTARIEAWRKMDEPPLAEVRDFAEALASKLEKALPKSSQSAIRSLRRRTHGATDAQ